MKCNERHLSKMSSGLPTESHLGGTGVLMVMVLNVDISNADEISRKITLALTVS